MSFKLLGTGRGIPRLSIDNHRLSEWVDTSDEWIVSRTGIVSRHLLTEERLLDLCAAAAKQALDNAGLEAAALDYILCATTSGDYVTPSMACLIQAALGASCPAFDINAACTGFIYALDMAAALMDSGRAERVLVVSAEAMSRHVDWTDRKTCVLFGDGAGAAVLTKGGCLLASRLTAKGTPDVLNIPFPYDSTPVCRHESPHGYLYMNGQEVFKFAVSALCRDIEDVLSQAGLTIADITMVLPHQANLRIIDAAGKRLGMTNTQMACNIDRYGNTSAASIPILLSELMDNGALREGDLILMAAFGGGLTSGAILMRI